MIEVPNMGAVLVEDPGIELHAFQTSDRDLWTSTAASSTEDDRPKIRRTRS